LALVLATFGLAACGGDDATETGAETTSGGDLSDDPGEGSEEIVINTQVERSQPGEVLDGSTIGDSPFCPGGTFEERHGNDAIGLVDRTFTCPDGSLRIGFTPGAPEGDTQSGPWRVVSGTGAYEGLSGNGEMETTYEPGSVTKGRETFLGTVSR
jgi:hypothetical protein